MTLAHGGSSFSLFIGWVTGYSFGSRGSWVISPHGFAFLTRTRLLVDWTRLLVGRRPQYRLEQHWLILLTKPECVLQWEPILAISVPLFVLLQSGCSWSWLQHVIVTLLATSACHSVTSRSHLELMIRRCAVGLGPIPWPSSWWLDHSLSRGFKCRFILWAYMTFKIVSVLVWE